MKHFPGSQPVYTPLERQKAKFHATWDTVLEMILTLQGEDAERLASLFPHLENTSYFDLHVRKRPKKGDIEARILDSNGVHSLQPKGGEKILILPNLWSHLSEFDGKGYKHQFKTKVLYFEAVNLLPKDWKPTRSTKREPFIAPFLKVAFLKLLNFLKAVGVLALIFLGPAMNTLFDWAATGLIRPIEAFTPFYRYAILPWALLVIICAIGSRKEETNLDA